MIQCDSCVRAVELVHNSGISEQFTNLVCYFANIAMTTIKPLTKMKDNPSNFCDKVQGEQFMLTKA